MYGDNIKKAGKNTASLILPSMYVESLHTETDTAYHTDGDNHNPVL